MASRNGTRAALRRAARGGFRPVVDATEHESGETILKHIEQYAAAVLLLQRAAAENMSADELDEALRAVAPAIAECMAAQQLADDARASGAVGQ